MRWDSAVVSDSWKEHGKESPGCWDPRALGPPEWRQVKTSEGTICLRDVEAKRWAPDGAGGILKMQLPLGEIF